MNGDLITKEDQEMYIRQIFEIIKMSKDDYLEKEAVKIYFRSINALDKDFERRIDFSTPNKIDYNTFKALYLENNKIESITFESVIKKLSENGMINLHLLKQLNKDLNLNFTDQNIESLFNYLSEGKDDITIQEIENILSQLK